MKPILFSTPMVQAILDGRKIKNKVYKKAFPDLTDEEIIILRIFNGIKHDVKTGCWNWQRSHNIDGYGTITINRETKLVTRVCYKIAFGSIPDGGQVLHYCDNPKCCNPDHLHLGTRFDNMKECYERGRSSIKPVSFVGSKNPAAKLKETDIPEIRWLLNAKNTQKSIAEKYHVSQATIGHIANKRKWAHVN